MTLRTSVLFPVVLLIITLTKEVDCILFQRRKIIPLKQVRHLQP
jgi:hypothetical protein